MNMWLMSLKIIKHIFSCYFDINDNHQTQILILNKHDKLINIL